METPIKKSRTAATALMAVVVILLLSGVVAFAASLGGILSASITASSSTGLPYNASVSDIFTGPNGTMNGRVIATGQIWTQHSGTWVIASNQARQTQNATNRTISIPWFDANTRVQADMRLQGGTYNSGIMMNVNAAGTTAVVLRIRNTNIAELGYLNGGVFTVWASAAPTAGGTNTWLMEYNHTTGDVVAKRNGTTIITYNIPSGSRAAINANTRVGLYSSGNVGNDRWDNFSVVSF